MTEALGLLGPGRFTSRGFHRRGEGREVHPVTFLCRKAKAAFVKRYLTGLFSSFFEPLKFEKVKEIWFYCILLKCQKNIEKCQIDLQLVLKFTSEDLLTDKSTKNVCFDVSRYTEELCLISERSSKVNMSSEE